MNAQRLSKTPRLINAPRPAPKIKPHQKSIQKRCASAMLSLFFKAHATKAG